MSTDDTPEQGPEIVDVSAQPQPGPSAPRAAPAPGAGPAPATGVISAPAMGVNSSPATGVNPALETRVKSESASGANSASATGREIFGPADPEVQYLGAVPRNRQQGENLTYNLFTKKHYYSNISLIQSVMLPKLLLYLTLPHYFLHPPANFHSPSRNFLHPPALFSSPSRIIFHNPPAKLLLILFAQLDYFNVCIFLYKIILNYNNRYS
jgi:hypothetical protein